jgi:2-dehydropantoate 2-reductase
MRYVIYGAGAVGGTIGAALVHAGADVAFIARGEHGRVLAADGLRFGTPDGWETLRVPTVAHPAELTFRSGDVVLLAMKSQDTTAALTALAQTAGPDLPIVCAQNGVANERRALRRFADVHGMCVMMPAVHIEPGVVHVHSTPTYGTCDVGRFPNGLDALDETLAADLLAGSLRSTACADIMVRKHAKLLANLTNVLEAACGRDALTTPLADRARAEGAACYAAAGIVAERGGGGALPRGFAPVDGVDRPGGSTYQSLARGAATLETDDINGEIVLLGRLHGVPTPVNAMLQRLALRLVAERIPPGSLRVEELAG